MFVREILMNILCFIDIPESDGGHFVFMLIWQFAQSLKFGNQAELVEEYHISANKK